MNCIFRLREEYDRYLDLSGGFDPDFPEVNIGGRDKGQKIKGTNKIQAEEREKLNLNRTEDDLPEDTVRYDNDESGQNAEGTREILNLHK